MRQYSRQTAEELADLLARGEVSISEACKTVGISIVDFHDWKNEVPEFSNILKIADEIKAENQLIMALNGQKRLLTGYLQVEEIVHYDPNDEIVGRSIKKKWIPPRANSIIHALNALSDRFANPERYNNPQQPPKQTAEGENPIPVVNFSPNIYLNIPTTAKSLKIGQSTEN